MRQRWFEKQLATGIVPAGTELALRNPGVEAWDDLSNDKKALYLRMQEAFAGFLDHTDDQIGRLIEFLGTIDVLDDTLLILMSDNGASQEGGKHGTLNELAYFNQIGTPVETMLASVDEIGDPNIYNNYPWGWAQVGNTPLRFYKQNLYEGGIRDPLIVHWPNGISDAGGLRTQYHVSDLLPTCSSVSASRPPTSTGACPSSPSRAPASGTPSTLRPNRPASAPSTTRCSATAASGTTAGRPSRCTSGHPLRRRPLGALPHRCRLLGARRSVQPASREAPRVGRPMVGRGGQVQCVAPRRPGWRRVHDHPSPGSEPPGNVQRILPTSPHLERSRTPDIRNRSFEIRAWVSRAPGDDGVLAASGARTGGYALYVRDGHAVSVYNRLGTMYEARSPEPLPDGDLDIVVRYAKTGEHQGTAHLVLAQVDGSSEVEVASGPVETLPDRQTLYGMDIGRESGPTVSGDYVGPFSFEG